ncbi:MAG: PfkB family carbohydrate kinase [Limisphaerales bacterium]
MPSPQELREHCAARLSAATAQARQLTAFIGFDGFVDDIIHLVDTRRDAQHFDRIPTIAKLAERLAAAAGKSTNIELVSQRVKLGGNGPIMANALAQFGLGVTYLGALGWPARHPVFDDFAKRADVHSIATPGMTDAFEFEDGKILFGKTVQLGDVNWANIQERYGREKFAHKLFNSHLVGFVNWTMLPYMSDIWEAVQKELGAPPQGTRRTLFVDLADPAKRTPEDILRALKLITNFQEHFDVILGLNEKEAWAVAGVIGHNAGGSTPEDLCAAARAIQKHAPVKTVVVHPVSYAFACTGGECAMAEGPFVGKPLITTGAGDHFNAGFCLGKLLGLEDQLAVLTGVSTSGFYVRNARSPTIADLAGLLRNWPSKDM